MRKLTRISAIIWFLFPFVTLAQSCSSSTSYRYSKIDRVCESYAPGDQVQVLDGVFKDQTFVVQSVDNRNETLKVQLNSGESQQFLFSEVRRVCLSVAK